MLPNDDLARWGERPTTPDELALAELLGAALERDLADQPHPPGTAATLQRDAGPVVQVCRWIDDMMDVVLARAAVGDAIPAPPEPVALRLTVARWVGGAWQRLSSPQPRPCVVRDMRRVPADPERVGLRTGDRVRVEIVADRAGYLTVFNVGPRGTLNLLHPHRPAEQRQVAANEAVLIADVEMTPPAGAERLYGVWSVAPLAAHELTAVARGGVAERDMKRVNEALAPLPVGGWHAVLLELDHQAE